MASVDAEHDQALAQALQTDNITEAQIKCYILGVGDDDDPVMAYRTKVSEEAFEKKLRDAADGQLNLGMSKQGSRIQHETSIADTG